MQQKLSETFDTYRQHHGIGETWIDWTDTGIRDTKRRGRLMRVYMDVAYHIMTNDLHRAMKQWLCTSKEELTREQVARTWDETVDNVWHRLAACDHLLDLKSWKKGGPLPGQGISYAAATRNLRILRRRLEEVMGKSARLMDPPWLDISKEQWDLLWSGEGFP